MSWSKASSGIAVLIVLVVRRGARRTTGAAAADQVVFARRARILLAQRNTSSMRRRSRRRTVDLVFNAADNDPAAQMSAVRSFINQGVDAIVIAPIVEDGWDDVLEEAKDADIPVILEDRTVSASDDLYASWVGLDFKQEGVTAGEWAAENFTEPTNMVVLEGTTGSAPANDRAEGFTEGMGDAPIETIDSQTGEFTRDGGKTVMEGFLQKYGVDGIDLVYAHNDDMALGAIEAIEAAEAPGEDIKIRCHRRGQGGCRRSSTARSTSSSSATAPGREAADLVRRLSTGRRSTRLLRRGQSFNPSRRAEVIGSGLLSRTPVHHPRARSAWSVPAERRSSSHKGASAMHLSTRSPHARRDARRTPIRFPAVLALDAVELVFVEVRCTPHG